MRKNSSFPGKKQIRKLRRKVTQKWMKKLSFPKKKKKPTLNIKVAKKWVRKLSQAKEPNQMRKVT